MVSFLGNVFGNVRVGQCDKNEATRDRKGSGGNVDHEGQKGAAQYWDGEDQ